jgi:O-methyltransferase
VKQLTKKMLRRVRRPTPAGDAALDLDSLLAGVDLAERPILERALPHTMTGVPRLRALVDAVRYCVRRDVPGAFAECGVWRGGSVLAMILTLQELGLSDRDIHLYDTFEGMTAPTEVDVSPLHTPALDLWDRTQGMPWPEFFDPEVFNEEMVRETVLSTGYPQERLHFVRGPVESTLPEHAPERLALLRLDTDWYESTRHELRHLYPRLSSGGVLIVDDYGEWEGARRAVDEYFAAEADPVLLNRIDHSGRIAVKL